MPLDKLNEQQKKAVTTTEGPVMIVAGAGTGKTTVLTEKVAYLIDKKLASPDQILALTFTDQASGEMEERVDRMLPYGYVDLWIMTFHSFCEKVLQEHGFDIGLPGDFKLLNQTEQWLLARQNLEKFDLTYYRPLGNPTKFLHELLKHFSKCKDEEIFPENYLKYADKLKIDLDQMESGARETGEIEVERIGEVAGAYHTYQQLLLENNSLDFGDLINYTLKLFKTRPQILEKYQKKFKYVLVDEFQDTNWVQYELVKLLVGEKQNLTVVGDDDQSIYKFRGASVSNILQFKDDFPHSKEIYLNQNYRSAQNILDLSYNFIQLNNPERLECKLSQGASSQALTKKLTAHTPEIGDIELITAGNHLEEVEKVVSKIVELESGDTESTWDDFAILVRSNAQAENFLNGLRQAHIPHTYIASKGLYQKEVILDTFAYLNLLDNYHESKAFWRILNLPIFDFPITDILEMNRYARRKSMSLFEVATRLKGISNITEETKEKVGKILILISKHTLLAKKESIKKVVLAFFKDFGYYQHLLSQNDTTAFNYLNKLFKKIDSFENSFEDKSLKSFSSLIEMEKESGETGDLDKDFDEGPQSVKVMTVHSAKGLEFKYVFVVNLASRRFPSDNRSDKIQLPDELVKEIIPGGDVHLQEERRLFYVALTRAKQGLYLTHALNYGGKNMSKPSRFLHESQLLAEEPKDASSKKNIKTDSAIKAFSEDSLDISLAEQKENIKKFNLPKSFSFSQLRAYEACPYQYYLNFILKIPVEGSGVFSFGRAMHNTLQDLFEQIKQDDRQENFFEKDQRSKELPSLKELLAFYEHNWIDDYYESKKQQQDYKEMGEKSLKNIHADLEKEGLPQTIAVEKDFNLKIGGYTIKGQIDRVDQLPNGKMEIVDYKTGTPKTKLSKEDKSQLFIYQMAAEEVFGWEVEKLTFHYLNDNTKVSFIGKASELADYQEKILETISEIIKLHFTPKPSDINCKYCDFNNICSYRKK